MKIERVLIVDDEKIMRNFLETALQGHGLEVKTACNGREGLSHLRHFTPDLVITDMNMPELTGMQLLEKIKQTTPATLVTIITAFGSISNAVEAMRSGAFDYILKPFSIDAIDALLAKANEHYSLVQENAFLKKEIEETKNFCVAESAVMKKIIADARRVATSDANVFIFGESGTGKEVIAREIHTHSLRKNAPFIKVNCAAMPDTLIESEFFGHEKGAFTGAIAKKMGRFELADKGTLLLDEISEIPIQLQAKLLRVTQEKEFERLGGTKSIRVDVRLISTSNRNIEEMVQKGALREDLFYRLNVIPLFIPPLRERKEDILPLADLFLTRFCHQNHQNLKTLSSAAKEKLLCNSWPGNVRELSNAIERAVVMTAGDVIYTI